MELSKEFEAMIEQEVRIRVSALLMELAKREHDLVIPLKSAGETPAVRAWRTRKANERKAKRAGEPSALPAKQCACGIGIGARNRSGLCTRCYARANYAKRHAAKKA
jgi:hypothetical protein